jgi:diguanylate cyclase (GGDEF)-like protein
MIADPPGPTQIFPMVRPSPGRRFADEELRFLDRRSWQLWLTSLLSTLALAAAVVLLLYPAVRWGLGHIEIRRGPLAQLVVGLAVVVILETIYLVTKQKEINDLRNFLISTQSFAMVHSADYPQDPLTGAYDRRALPEILEREREWVERYRVPLCLVLLDIRGFSRINDAEGHMGGDAVLKELAATLKTLARQSDTVVRYGPDQFLCLLPRTDLAGGNGFVRRVDEAVKKSPRLASVGMDSGIGASEPGGNADRLLADVENNLAEAKSRNAAPVAATVRIAATGAN